MIVSLNMTVSQKFWNILVTWGPIQLVQMLLLNLWRCQTILDSEILSSPDTLQVLLIRFIYIAWSKVLESTLLGLGDLTWFVNIFLMQGKFLEPFVYDDPLHFHLSLYKCFWLLLWRYCNMMAKGFCFIYLAFRFN